MQPLNTYGGFSRLILAERCVCGHDVDSWANGTSRPRCWELLQLKRELGEDSFTPNFVQRPRQFMGMVIVDLFHLQRRRPSLQANVTALA